MSGKFFTGFESGVQDGLWSTSNFDIVAGESRTGSGSFTKRVNSSSTETSVDFSVDLSTDTIYAGWNVRHTLSTQSGIDFSVGANGGSNALFYGSVFVNSDGSIQAASGDSTFSTALNHGSTAAGVFNTLTDHYIELVWRCHDTLGVHEVWLDGVQVLSFSGDTKRDTSALGPVTNCNFNVKGSTSRTYQIDDVYVCTDTADGNDPWVERMGQIVCEAVAVDSDDTVAMTPTAATNWESVSAIPADSDNVSSDVPTTEDTYGIGARPSHTGAPLGVTMFADYDKDGTGTRQMETHFISGAADETETLSPANGARKVSARSFYANPDGGAAWVDADIASLKIGVEVV